MVMTVAGFLGAQTYALECRWSKVGQQYVSVGRQLVHDADPPVARQIKGDTPLPPIVELEDRVDWQVPSKHSTEVPARITLGWLYFDNVGAPIGQDAPRSGSRHPNTQLDDAYTLKRTGHAGHRSEFMIKGRMSSFFVELSH
jgi:hypothetical protein